jgi:hypothetical protein
MAAVTSRPGTCNRSRDFPTCCLFHKVPGSNNVISWKLLINPGGFRPRIKLQNLTLPPNYAAVGQFNRVLFTIYESCGPGSSDFLGEADSPPGLVKIATLLILLMASVQLVETVGIEILTMVICADRQRSHQDVCHLFNDVHPDPA